MEYTSQLAHLISTSMIGLTALVSLRVYFIRAPHPLKMLSHLWLLWFAIELIGLLMPDVESNVWMYNLWFFFYFFYLARIYFEILEREWLRVIVQVFYGTFIVFTLINSLFLQGLDRLQTLTFVTGGVFVIFLAVAYFWQMLVSSENQWITRDPFFWLSFGLIVNLGGSVPFFGMFNYLESNFYTVTVLYHRYISNGFSIFLSVLVLIAFLCRKNYPNRKLY